MAAWIAVSIAAFVGLAGTVVALLADRSGGEPAASRPSWLLPSPRDVRAPRFRHTFQGYDPAEVDVHLEAVALAYEALQDAAGSEAIERAEQEVALRLGLEGPAAETGPDDVGTELR